MSKTAYYTTAPNAHRLLYAGFMAILAAGVGFSVRAGILGQWADQFGFTMTQLGSITGGGLAGFGAVIILTSLFADKIGYGKIMILAFILHFLSAVMTLGAQPAFEWGGKDAAYWSLFFAMLIFSIANGLCEAVVNPLTAALFPKDKSHFLNILHAGWPAGLALGGIASYLMAAKIGEGGIVAPAIDWKIQMSFFLIPVMLYGAMLVGQKFPKSEASAAGISIRQMVSTLFAPLMLLLLIIHAMVGYVELGTDMWISKITGSIMGDNAKGLALLVYTSLLMFFLRFTAGPIVHRISPLGLLFASAVIGALGLRLLGGANTVYACILAATVYALGKTFLWPTMLAVASERFPHGGSMSVGMLGGVGMLSAGLIGGPMIGMKQDYYASQYLKQNSPEVFQRYQAEDGNRFLWMSVDGLDGTKVKILEDAGTDLIKADQQLALETETASNRKKFETHQKFMNWWSAAQPHLATDRPFVSEAGTFGGKQALLITAFVPMLMALLYLLMIIGFRMTGGYKAIHLTDSHPSEIPPEALGTAES